MPTKINSLKVSGNIIWWWWWGGGGGGGGGGGIAFAEWMTDESRLA